MRKIQTFILRLLMDTEESQALRGAVRFVSNAEEHTFADGQSLLALLRRMCQTSEPADEEEGAGRVYS